jgi:hypothetical protein
MDEVMPVAPIRRAGATGESALLVADDERAPEGGLDGASAATDVDGLGVGAEKHSGHGAVACDSAHDVGGDGLRPGLDVLSFEIVDGGVAWCSNACS